MNKNAMGNALKRACLLIGCSCTLLLASCVKVSPPDQSGTSLPAAFSNSGSAVLPASWWTTFESDQLNDLIDRSLQSNFDLLEAWERLQAANALLKRQASQKLPQVDGSLQRRYQETESSSTSSWEIGLSAAYQVDLWGRIRSQVDAERFRAIASEADYQAAALTLSAVITRNYFRLLTANAERELLRSQLDNNEKIYESLMARFGAGQGERADLLRQAQLVEASRGQIFLADAEARLLQNQLAVLAGVAPGESEFVSNEFVPELPQLPATGVPVELVQRRPDVLASYLDMQAADADLAASVAETYPRISISASLDTDDRTVDLFDEWTRSLAGNLLVPLFDGSRRKAEVERAEALRNQAFYAYSQSVLTAIREVEDALVLEGKQTQRLGSLNEQVRLARESYMQLQLQYTNGAADFLDVLTALTNEQRLRRDLLQAGLDVLETRIDLYIALAGPIDQSTITTSDR